MGIASLQAPPSRRLPDVTRERNAWLEVDLAATEHNVRALRASLRPGVELIAVVKANAYGHGVAALAPALEAAGVDRFAVVWAAEAFALRALGVSRPILVLGHAFPADAEQAVLQDITLTVHSASLGDALSRAAQTNDRVARIHIKVDTGLHRFGLGLEEAVGLAEHLRRFPALEVEGLTTHMANADEADDSFAELQHAVFSEAERRLPWIRYRHTANSATALRRPDLQYEGVRLGLALHGILPPNSPPPPGGLKPVLSLKARLARVAELPPGDGVSYGLTWRAERPSRVGLVPVGYADGWRRSLGNRGHVLVAGQRCPIIGRVAMDQFLVDVTDVPSAAEGTEVVLLGRQRDDEITVDEIAAFEDTISWEVTAALQARLPRIAHRDGHVQTIIET